MKYLFSLLTILTLGLGSGFAQTNKQLEINEIGDGTDVHIAGSRHEAQIVFEVNDEFKLSFRSNLDDELDIKFDSINELKKSYAITLITQEPGVSYESRVITIMAPGFEDVEMPFNLKDREKHIYSVSDPYSKLVSPFFTYQEKGNELYRNGEYQSARDYFKLTRACPEYPDFKEDIDEHIADCDSLIEWSLRAAEHERFSEWEEALDVYRQMMRLNNSNQLILESYRNCRKSFEADCEAEFRNGEHYMAQASVEDLKKAEECFQRVLDKKCSTKTEEASVNLRNIKSRIAKENDHSRSLFVEAGINMNQFGFTYANCYNRQNKHHGGYFTMRANQSLVDFASQKGYAKGTFTDCTDPTTFSYSDDYEFNSDKKEWAPKDKLDYEAQVTWGWTNQIYRWFFIHYGFGYHGGGFYTFEEEKYTKASQSLEKYHVTDLSNEASWTNNFRNAYSKANLFHGAAGEIGLIVKVWRFNLKGTYQYTYWVTNEYESFFEKQHNNVYVGLGFNW